jgi:hypothetical protein
MEHRVFVHYKGLTGPMWIDTYLRENVGEFGKHWWSQCVTDAWDSNTNCYYFEDSHTAQKFEMICKLRDSDVV